MLTFAAKDLLGSFPQCVGEMVIYAYEPRHAAKIHRSVTTYSVQNSISDTLSVWPSFPFFPGFSLPITDRYNG
jgi:hypothetical protein